MRRAAEAVYGKDLLLYEDFPYARSRWSRLRARGLPGRWRSRTWPADVAALGAKCRAIACYRSQLVTVFAGLEDMERQVRGFAAERRGERLWQRRSLPGTRPRRRGRRR